MNLEQNKKLEAQLRQLKPMRVAPKVEANIELSLREEKLKRQMRKLRSAMSWGAFGLAASILLVMGYLLFNGFLLELAPQQDDILAEESVEEANPEDERTTGSSGMASDFEPVLAENNLRNRIDEGIVFLNNGLTARRYRYEFVDRVVWRNPTDGATMEVEIPRDEVILVPVQTF